MTGHRCRCKQGLCVEQYVQPPELYNTTNCMDNNPIRSAWSAERRVLTLGWLWVSERSLLAADGLIMPALLLYLLTHSAGVPILHLGVRVSAPLPLTLHMNPSETHNKQPSMPQSRYPLLPKPNKLWKLLLIVNLYNRGISIVNTNESSMCST